ncbi:MAG: DUF4142 domain-containing protein [Chitinophagales bacterium]|nr:DUF4142 domain-containing protein [Chitinophagales bacterium]
MRNKILCLFMTVTFFACNNAANDSVDEADSINKANRENAENRYNDSVGEGRRILTPTEETADFLVRAANATMTEIQLTQLAMDKSSLSSIRSLSKELKKDHQEMNDEIKRLARERNIALPDMVSNESEKDLTDLRQRSGNDFDKEFIKEIIDRHDESIRLYENAVSKGDAPEVRDFASKCLPALRSHRDKAKDLQDKTWK